MFRPPAHCINCYIQHALLLLLLVSITACNNSDDLQSNNNSVKTFIPAPEEKKPTNPTTIEIAPLPKPLIIPAVPRNKGLINALPFFRNYNTEQGLPSNSILCSTTDHLGNVWFGTSAGLSRFDGKDFTNFTISNGLPSNVIFQVMQDSKGNIWLGTSSGACKYDGYSFIPFTDKEGLPGKFIFSVLEDHKGNIWFGSDGGLIKYDGKIFTGYTVKDGLPHNTVRALMHDERGRLWIGTAEGLAMFNGFNFFVDTSFNELKGKTVNQLLQDKKKAIWIATEKGLFNYQNTGFKKFDDTQTLSNGNVQTILEDHKGNLWFGTISGGICKYDGKKIITYNTEHGLADNNITSIVKDNNDDLWFCSVGGGISYFSGNFSKRYTKQQGLPGVIINGLTEDKNGSLWLATTDRGIIKLSGDTVLDFSHVKEIATTSFWSVFQNRDGNLWFASQKQGAFFYNGKEFLNFTTAQGLINNNVYCVYQDRSGKVWFGTNNGLSLFDGTSITNYTVQNGLAGNNIQVILEDRKGNMWFSTHDEGIMCFDGNIFKTYTDQHGLPSNTVYALHEDKRGNLWIGTNKGASMFNGSSFSNYTTSSGLANDFIWMIAEDTSNDLIWLGTNDGLTALKSTTNKTAQFSVINYNSRSGLPVKQVNAGALLVDSKNRLWIGSADNHLVNFVFPPQKNSSNNFPVEIINVKINDENLCWSLFSNNNKNDVSEGDKSMMNGIMSTCGKILTENEIHKIEKKYRNLTFDSIKRFYPVPVNLRLPYHANNITIEFTAPAPGIAKQILYQYKLENYHASWTRPSYTSNAVFGNLRHGNYLLKVKAFHSQGGVAETEYAFSILPPWWLTWWAISLYTITVISLIYLFYRTRIRLLEKKRNTQMNIMVETQEDERKRIARDLHDDVGVKLSALKLSLSSLREKTLMLDNNEVEALAEGSEKLVTEAMHDVRHILRNLSPDILEEFGYTTAIETIVNKINETNRIYFHLVVFGLHKRLSRDYELVLYRITQELINNILKHAKASHVTLQIGHRDGKIILMIEDDGVGFNVNDQKNKGYGLQNLEIRTKLMKGVMILDAHPGRGTNVLIEIPYKF